MDGRYFRDVGHAGICVAPYLRASSAAIAEVIARDGAIAVIMTAVVVLAVVSRPRKDRQGVITIEAGVLIGVYAIAGVVVFTVG